MKLSTLITAQHLALVTIAIQFAVLVLTFIF
jgi:hypothetical protein